MTSSHRLAIFATHPVQYHTALWRSLAAVPGLEIHVFYFSDVSVRGGVDPGFGVPVAWDVPLLDGYPHTFLSRDADITKPWGVGYRGARRLLAEGRYDWVLLQGYTHRFERQVLRAAKGLGVRVVLRGEFCDQPRGGSLRMLVRDLYLRWFYRRVDAFCYIGETARCHLTRMDIPSDRLFFSPYHVDSALFEQNAAKLKREDCRASLGIGPNKWVLLFSGKLIPRKEPLLLLEAIRRLPDHRGLELIILGDGPLWRQVTNEGRALLGERLHAPGFVNQTNLGPYFAAADVLILPSNYETWGLVVNEAMYFGLPCVVSDRVGCHPDLVRQGETGWVFRSGDSAALAQVLQELITDRAAMAAMGEKARMLVRHYSTEAARDGILKTIGFADP
jgi:glycosyltransferase involved in cell wall biosynthesis